jgi:hypothetical protein
MEGSPVLRLKLDEYAREHDTNSTSLRTVHVEVVIAISYRDMV